MGDLQKHNNNTWVQKLYGALAQTLRLFVKWEAKWQLEHPFTVFKQAAFQWTCAINGSMLHCWGKAPWPRLQFNKVCLFPIKCFQLHASKKMLKKITVKADYKVMTQGNNTRYMWIKLIQKTMKPCVCYRSASWTSLPCTNVCGLFRYHSIDSLTTLSTQIV